MTVYRGGVKSETMHGKGAANDLMCGNRGDDVLYGEDGNDFILGNAGSDTLKGGAGNDILDGGRGNDFVYGGAGNDFVGGGRGVDTLSGGSGKDSFLFFSTSYDTKAPEAAVDKITDFASGETLLLFHFDKNSGTVNSKGEVYAKLDGQSVHVATIADYSSSEVVKFGYSTDPNSNMNHNEFFHFSGMMFA